MKKLNTFKKMHIQQQEQQEQQEQKQYDNTNTYSIIPKKYT